MCSFGGLFMWLFGYLVVCVGGFRLRFCVATLKSTRGFVKTICTPSGTHVSSGIFVPSFGASLSRVLEDSISGCLLILECVHGDETSKKTFPIVTA